MRARDRLRLREIKALTDGTHLHVYEGADKHGRTTFAHVTDARYQIFTTNLDQWLSHYGLALKQKD